jgi:catechol 2,3-dioxygenase-like lactoylglutathione lyase family enzyme
MLAGMAVQRMDNVAIVVDDLDAAVAAGPGPGNLPPDTLGLHRVMFAVDDIGDTVARLRAHGAELLGEVAQYENIFLLCYLRGPAGIIVALAEQIG